MRTLFPENTRVRTQQGWGKIVAFESQPLRFGVQLDNADHVRNMELYKNGVLWYFRNDLIVDMKSIPPLYTWADDVHYQGRFTIIEKIEFSGITKERLEAELKAIDERVPRRTVLLNYSDEDITELWLKNWIHPQLKHLHKGSPRDKQGVSQEGLVRDSERDTIKFYENGQHNFIYSLQHIRHYVDSSYSDNSIQKHILIKMGM